MCQTRQLFLVCTLTEAEVRTFGAFQFYRKKIGVVVFQQSSRGENTILDILPRNEVDTVSFGTVLGSSLEIHTHRH